MDLRFALSTSANALVQRIPFSLRLLLPSSPRAFGTVWVTIMPILQSARHGLAWYEIGMNWYGISVLRMVGLAREVKAQKLGLDRSDEGRRAVAPQLLPLRCRIE